MRLPLKQGQIRVACERDKISRIPRAATKGRTSAPHGSLRPDSCASSAHTALLTPVTAILRVPRMSPHGKSSLRRPFLPWLQGHCVPRVEAVFDVRRVSFHRYGVRWHQGDRIPSAIIQ